MPVVIKYVVERDGIEKMTFTSKAEADAYDKLLDTADALYEFLDNSPLAGDQKQKEALSMYLAENKDSLLEAIGSKKKLTSKNKKTNKETKATPQLELTEGATREPLEDLVIEPDEDAVYEEDDTTVILDGDELVDYTESNAAA
ncbi:YebG family protein [Marinomonas transparens]|uniref:YebG family protein n=1 Tax=Marinomonas transparens TaxID=2795388 RepID=A0A934JUY9_9GAMM|nr:YebG family protein [Marinomonas transparens]